MRNTNCKPEAQFLDVIGTKVASTNGFYFKNGFNVNIVYGNLKSENSQDYA